MIIEKHDFSPDLMTALPGEVTEKTLFFDIETTGFSPKTSHLYMIGCSYMTANGFKTIQWFDETKTSDGEYELLKAFTAFAADFNRCISFNGTTFDFPYIRKKCTQHRLDDPLSHLEHIDIYKKLKPYKNLLKLPDLKQKSLEAFLGIHREDKFSGGQLIAVYDACISTWSDRKFRQLMKHNYDDICGMIALMPIMAYFKLFDGDFHYVSARLHENILTLNFSLEHFILIPIRSNTDFFDIRISAYTMTIAVYGLRGTLKYFYKNPKDYYYLPMEDIAVHKSVAAFVDKAFKQKATKETCYTKKSSFFLPQPQSLFTPDYQENAAGPMHYFTWDTIENNEKDICRYGQMLLSML